jgi:hypothetical protein
MTREDIKNALEEINTPGSDLNSKYKRWCRGSMTIMVAEILQYLSNADQTIRTVPIVDKDSACTMLGYVSGRSHCAADMVGLDTLQPTEMPELKDEYISEEGE